MDQTAVSVTVDLPRLRSDVERIARSNNLSMRDCWEYIADHYESPEWLRRIAREEIEAAKTSVVLFCDGLPL